MFVGASVFAAGAFAAGGSALAGGAGFVSVAGAVFALASAGVAVFALASVVAAGASGFEDKTEMLPVNTGIASNRASAFPVACWRELQRGKIGVFQDSDWVTRYTGVSFTYRVSS